jgi:hypothetical protein
MAGIVGLTFFLGMALVAGLDLPAVGIHAAYLVPSGFVRDDD